MRKIYSIVLTACALLLSTSLFAVDVTTRQQIQDAITGASEGQTVNILLKNNIDVDATITINAGQIVNVDLNGHNMKADGAGVFILRKGTLNIIGTGTIEKTGRTETDAIRVYGSDDPTVANYSNLTIGENVTMNVHGPKKKDTTDGLEEDGYMIETTNAITVMEQGTSPETLKAAYGVNIEIKGKVYGSKYGVKINGNVTGNVYSTDPENKYDNRPYVHVASTAEVYCNPSTNNATAIYSSGVGRFLIEGYVHGASAVFVKSGTVELNDAVVKSDYVGTFNDDHKKKGSGINARGSAITIQSQSNYAGGQAVTIKGDTKVEAGSGYAIEETIKSGTTKVNSIVIEGGTIETGANGKGAILFTEATKNAAEQDIANIEIIGGNIENYVQIKEEGGNVVATTVDQFLPQTETDHYKTTAVTDEAGKTTIVVTYFENTADKPVVANSVVAAADETGIDWTVTADTEETLTDSKILTYLEAVSAANKQTLNVGDATHNVTLKVGRIVLGPKAKIVVAAGSRLIVDGKQGIVAPVASNIILETQEGKPAIFLFNPAVTSNRHPNATVKYTSKAYRTAENENIYQFFGSPFSAVENITASSSTYATQISVWNVNKYDLIGVINYDKVGLDASKAINYSKFNKKFGFYSMLTNNPEGEKQTYTMTGSMVGNENAEMPLYAEWTGMSNAYMGEMDVKAIEDANTARRAEGSKVHKFIYTYTQIGNNIVWTVNNPEQEVTYRTKLAPMEPFMMENRGNKENMQHSYADLVWTPATKTSTPAPARRNIATDVTKATIRVNGANGIFDRLTFVESSEYTSGLDEYDSPKYMNDGVNFYVMDEDRLNVLATDNVENTYLGFSCVKGGEFTLNFEKVLGNALTLIDLVNNTSVDLTEGATYTFTAADNEANDYRFKVINRRNAATAVENVEAAAKTAGIYTLTGMYLGEMNVWNTLPAGIYVVNGEKRVK